LERTKNKFEIVAFGVLILFFSVGAFGHLYEPLRMLMIQFTKYFLLMISFILSYYTFSHNDKKNIAWFTVTYVLTYLSEIIGVHTGLIFGNYNYGNVLGMKIFGVPPIIGLNWVFVILGSLQLANKISSNNFFKIILASALAVIFDLILEPVAIKLDYWKWLEGQIPVYNYISWFVIAFTASFFFIKFKIDLKTELLYKFFLIQFFFFLIINIGFIWEL